MYQIYKEEITKVQNYHLMVFGISKLRSIAQMDRNTPTGTCKFEARARQATPRGT